MVVRGENGAKQELFGLFDSSTPIPRPSQWGSTISHAGERITLGSAAGLPAFLRGVRLIAETAAGLPICLYRGYGTSRMPVENAPQMALLRRPNPEQSAFTFWSYVFTSMIRGNAYIYKVKVRNRAVALYTVNPACVTPKYDGASVTFEVKDREYGPVVDEVGPDRIIHIPGILLEDPYVGVSVVEAHRHSLGNELGRQRFEGRYIANDASPGLLLKHPGNVTKEQRDEIRASVDSRHAGASQAGRTALVWGGWDMDHAPISLNDAQFIESKRYSVQDIGRMLGIPSGLLNDPDAPGGDSPEQENMRFLKHGLKSWMERAEQGVEKDRDLFPEPDWEVEFDENGFLRADIQTRYNAYRLGRQGGWVTANEIRSLEGLPPVDGGDEIQETPVGGAANQSSNTGTTDGSSDA